MVFKPFPADRLLSFFDKLLFVVAPLRIMLYFLSLVSVTRIIDVSFLISGVYPRYILEGKNRCSIFSDMQSDLTVILF